MDTTAIGPSLLAQVVRARVGLSRACDHLEDVRDPAARSALLELSEAVAALESAVYLLVQERLDQP